jgi:methylated-DNA-[protein]-cysteine S-methyltransferase
MRVNDRAETMSYAIIKSPIDDLILVADNSALTGLYFAGEDQLASRNSDWKRNPRHPLIEQAANQLKEYFLGKRKRFSIPFRLEGTDFQEKIWRQIALIPYAETISYSELARRAGAPAAIRAAGTSTGRNPIAIIIPCHRVMGKNGAICGFAGGLDRKRYLLDLESSENDLFKKSLG